VSRDAYGGVKSAPTDDLRLVLVRFGGVSVWDSLTFTDGMVLVLVLVLVLVVDARRDWEAPIVLRLLELSE
jgi:hypothetical protein